jgi:hypothetical protein
MDRVSVPCSLCICGQNDITGDLWETAGPENMDSRALFRSVDLGWWSSEPGVSTGESAEG